MSLEETVLMPFKFIECATVLVIVVGLFVVHFVENFVRRSPKLMISEMNLNPGKELNEYTCTSIMNSKPFNKCFTKKGFKNQYGLSI